MHNEHTKSHELIEKKSFICKVVEAKYVDGYTIHVKFNDNAEGDVNLSELVNKGIFQQVKDLDKFANFSIDSGILTWSPNLDIAPEYLYSRLN